LLICAPAANAALSLDANFDHGSLLSWNLSGGLVNLVGRDNYFGGGDWRWLQFRATGVAGTRPVFSISDDFAGGGSALNGHSMVFSYDSQNWQFFENNTRSGGRFNFTNSFDFTQDQVFVAYSIPYSYGKSSTHSELVLQSPWAQPTFSANGSGVIGQSPGGIDDLGRTQPPRDLYSYRITNPATDTKAAKHKVVLMSGLHAGEVLGTHTLQGLVDFLISDDPRAQRLRDVAEFFVYPMVNVDGRAAGYNRSTVHQPGVDPNRVWHPSMWDQHPEVKRVGQAMIADVQSTPGTVVDAFIDFHSTIPAFPGDDFGYIEVEQGDNQAPFWREVRRLQPNLLEDDSSGSGWTSANFADAFLNAEVDITLETMFGYERPVEYYHQLGANFGIAFHNVWVPEPAATLPAIGVAVALTRVRRRGRRR